MHWVACSHSFTHERYSHIPTTQVTALVLSFWLSSGWFRWMGEGTRARLDYHRPKETSFLKRPKKRQKHHDEKHFYGERWGCECTGTVHSRLKFFSPGTKYKHSKIALAVTFWAFILIHLGTELLQLSAQFLIGLPVDIRRYSKNLILK